MKGRSDTTLVLQKHLKEFVFILPLNKAVEVAAKWNGHPQAICKEAQLKLKDEVEKGKFCDPGGGF